MTRTAREKPRQKAGRKEVNRMDKKPFVVNVDGVQVFSADFVFQQMQAQSCRIDRARRCAVIAAVVAAAAVALNLVLLLR